MRKKKIQKVRRFKIPCPVWEAEIYVVFGGKRSDANNWFRKQLKFFEQHLPDEYACPASCLLIGDCKCCGIWFDRLSPPTGVVGHEVFHIAYHIFSTSHLTLTKESQEAYAYFVGWLMNEIAKLVVDKM